MDMGRAIEETERKTKYCQDEKLGGTRPHGHDIGDRNAKGSKGRGIMIGTGKK